MIQPELPAPSPGVVYIYVLCDPRDGDIRYVGKTDDPKRRLIHHLAPCNLKQRSYKVHWIRQLIDLELRPIMRVACSADGETWADVEREWIDAARRNGCPITNLTDGGEGMYGYAASVETRAKIAKTLAGRQPPNAARVASSLYHRGRPKSPEHVEKVAAANRGKRRSVEDKAHLQGSKHYNAALLDAQVLEIRARFEQESISDSLLAKQYGVSKGCVNAIVYNHTWTHLPLCRYALHPSKRNTNPFPGASRIARSGRWQAELSMNGIRMYLGVFDTASEASAAYLKAKSASSS